MIRSVPLLSGRMRASHYLLAGLTHKELGVSYAEACRLLQDVDSSAVLEFEADLRGGGQEIVASTEELTVLDTAVAEGLWVRSLHFNDRIDLVQSSVHVVAFATR